MICPKCGEDNSDNFRFCGLCGTVLEARLDSRRPAGAPVQGLPKRTHAPEPLRPPVVENATVPASHQVPPISGPSMLGLNQAGTNQTSPNQPSANLPSMDSLRETAFSGLDSFFEPEQPKTGGRRILLLVVLLAALGGAGWWTYTNYLGATDSRKREAVTSSAGEAPAEKPPMKPSAKDSAPASDASSSQAVASAGAPQSQPGSAKADPDATRKTADAAAMPVVEAKPNPTTVAPAVPKIIPPDKSRVKREPRVTTRPSAKARPISMGEACRKTVTRQ
ncbi:MAG: zinc ribbon domain-containing protein [Terriglobales bacterium]